MANLAWSYKAWNGKLPLISTDEYYRHTLVVPYPFKTTDVEDDGTRYHPAVVLVVAPWWVCRHIFNSEYRNTVRRERQIAREDYAQILLEESSDEKD